VRGFGKVKLDDNPSPPMPGDGPIDKPQGGALNQPQDGPPPGTPPEFMGMPVIPAKKKATRPAVYPEKLAKLKQKMKEQGMLGDE
jgi:hypothetical protein